MKRDLLFIVGGLSAMLDERKVAVLTRQHGMGKPKDSDVPSKLLAAFLPKAEESKLGGILVETAILLSMHNQTDAAQFLRDAAHAYKVDVDAISATVKQEFMAKEKGKTNKKTATKPQPKSGKKAAAEQSTNHRISRSQQDRLRIFCARPLVDSHPHAMPRNRAGASFSPARRARGEAFG
jgi:ParB family chromosome partitioning protein